MAFSIYITAIQHAWETPKINESNMDSLTRHYLGSGGLKSEFSFS
jgi:hypothetical protein